MKEHKKIILVTGTTGQVGSELRELAPLYPEYDFVFAGREEMPLHEPVRIIDYLKKISPDYIVNTAAYTAVDKAETSEEECRIAKQINTEAPGIIAGYCQTHAVKLIHISTDYVFDGAAISPYSEEEVTNPQSVYGTTKRDGEVKVIQTCPHAIIIRTSWVYSSFGKNFVKTMLRLMKERTSIGVVNDQQGSPTYAADLAAAILDIVRSGKWEPGIYHYSNTGVISWFDFAKAIAEYTQSVCAVNGIPSSAYPTPAKRPAYSVLDTSKIRNTYAMQIPGWRESLQRCLQRIKNTPA